MFKLFRALKVPPVGDVQSTFSELEAPIKVTFSVSQTEKSVPALTEANSLNVISTESVLVWVQLLTGLVCKLMLTGALSPDKSIGPGLYVAFKVLLFGDQVPSPEDSQSKLS